MFIAKRAVRQKRGLKYSLPGKIFKASCFALLLTVFVYAVQGTVVKADTQDLQPVANWYQFQDGTTFYNSGLSASSLTEADLIQALLTRNNPSSLPISEDGQSIPADGALDANGESIFTSWQDVALEYILNPLDDYETLVNAGGDSRVYEYGVLSEVIAQLRDSNYKNYKDVISVPSIDFINGWTIRFEKEDTEIGNDCEFNNSGIQHSHSLNEANTQMMALAGCNKPIDSLASDASTQDVYWEFLTAADFATIGYDNNYKNIVGYGVVIDHVELVPLMPEDEGLYQEQTGLPETTNARTSLEIRNKNKDSFEGYLKESNTEEDSSSLETHLASSSSSSVTTHITDTLKVANTLEAKLGNISDKFEINNEYKYDYLKEDKWEQSSQMDYSKSSRQVFTTDAGLTKMMPGHTVSYINATNTINSGAETFRQPVGLQYRVQIVKYVHTPETNFSKVAATYGQLKNGSASASVGGKLISVSAQQDFNKRYTNGHDSQYTVADADGITYKGAIRPCGVSPLPFITWYTYNDSDYLTSIAYASPMVDDGISTITISQNKTAFTAEEPIALYSLNEMVLDTAQVPDLQVYEAGSDQLISLTSFKDAISLVDSQGGSYYGNVYGEWKLEVKNPDGTYRTLGDDESRVAQLYDNGRNPKLLHIGDVAGTVYLTFFPQANYYTSDEQTDPVTRESTYTSASDLQRMASITIRVTK